MTDYLEDALRATSGRRSRRTSRAAPNCTNYLDQMQQTIRLTGRLTEEALEPELRSQLLDAFRAFRRQE